MLHAGIVKRRTLLRLSCARAVYYQFVGGGRGLPMHLRLVLFAPLLSEGWLRAATLTVRGLTGGGGGDAFAGR